MKDYVLGLTLLALGFITGQAVGSALITRVTKLSSGTATTTA